MALTLSEIRAKLQAQEDKKTSPKFTGGDSAMFPHWNIEEGQSVRLRFLPDADPKNEYFWRERNIIRLPFAGVKGDSSSKPVIVQVPCIEMFAGYENKCPILAEVRPWYKSGDKELELQANKYWKKRSYFYQGFVRENTLADDTTPENPIRRFIISPQLFTLVKSALMDPELENLPTDYENGLDFVINKTAGKGGYADYNTSKWARKESALTATEAEAIEKFGLFNLGDFLPKMPTQEELDVMVEMFHASVDGQAYDPEKWGKYFKPAGLNMADADHVGPAATATPVPAPAVKVAEPSATVDSTPPWEDTQDDAPTATAPIVKPAAGGSRAEDILALIRNRQKTA